MPLKLNVGLSQKVSDNNFGSHGASVHIEAEVDSTVVTDTSRVQAQIRYLFKLARAAVAEELARPLAEIPNHANGAGKAPPSAVGNGNGRPTPLAANGRNGAGPAPTGNGSGKSRTATPSQVRAIRGIAQRLGVDLDNLLETDYRGSRLEELSVSDASGLIDRLKASVEASAERS